MPGRDGRPAEISDRNQKRLRALIKVTEIIEALNNHILAGAKMTNTQVRAAEILLRKVQPDLTATALTDDRSSALPLLQIVRKQRSDAPSSEVGAGADPAQAETSAKPDAA